MDSLLEGVPSTDEGVSSGAESQKRKHGATLAPLGENEAWPPLPDARKKVAAPPVPPALAPGPMREGAGEGGAGVRSNGWGGVRMGSCLRAGEQFS